MEKKERNVRPGPPKGVTNNPNGRPKGTKNVLTADLKEKMQNFLSGNFPQFIEDMKAIEDPGIRSKVYLEAFKTVVPRPVDEEDKEKENVFREQLLIALALK
jgi:hypothetical protein